MYRIVDKIVFHPLFVIIVSVLVVSGIIGLKKNSNRLELSKTNVQRKAQDRDRVKAEVLELDLKIEEANQPLAKDRLIRNQLLQQKEGEVVIKLPNTNNSKESQTDKTEVENWQKWLELVLP